MVSKPNADSIPTITRTLANTTWIYFFARLLEKPHVWFCRCVLEALHLVAFWTFIFWLGFVWTSRLFAANNANLYFRGFSVAPAPDRATSCRQRYLHHYGCPFRGAVPDVNRSPQLLRPLMHSNQSQRVRRV